MNTPFKFRYAGFRTVYEAKQTEQTISVFCGKEFVTFFEPSEMADMIQRGNIMVSYEDGKM